VVHRTGPRSSLRDDGTHHGPFGSKTQPRRPKAARVPEPALDESLADLPPGRLGYISVSGGGKPVAQQRARLAVGADHRGHAAGLVPQEPDLGQPPRRPASSNLLGVRRT